MYEDSVMILSNINKPVVTIKVKKKLNFIKKMLKDCIIKYSKK